MDSKLIGFKLHDKYDLVNTVFQVELEVLFSELASANLSIVEYVVDQEAQDFGTAHLYTDRLEVAITQLAQPLLELLALLFAGRNHGDDVNKLLVDQVHLQDLHVNGIDRVPHLMADRCIDQGKQSLLSLSLLIEYL